MNKILILTMVVLSVSANLDNLFECQSFNCKNQLKICSKDLGCMQALQFCFKQCNEESNECVKNCIESSNSLNAYKFDLCAQQNNCYYDASTFKAVSCPSTCLKPVQTALDYCTSVSDVPYPEVNCGIEQLSASNPECASKQCVCSYTLQLGLYIIGCQC